MARTALSGEPSDEPLTISIFLPPTLPPKSSTAITAPRMLSSPRIANAPSNVASTPILMEFLGHRRRRDRQSRGEPEAEKQASIYTHPILPGLDSVCARSDASPDTRERKDSAARSGLSLPHKPRRPSGEANTIARKTRPINVL